MTVIEGQDIEAKKAGVFSVYFIKWLVINDKVKSAFIFDSIFIHFLVIKLKVRYFCCFSKSA